VYDESTVQILKESLNYSKKRYYKGYDYWDGMSSKLPKKLPLENKWVNIAVQETIKRAPVNIRPFLLVEKRKNPLGISLFILANINAYELTKNEEYLKEASDLTQWLIENRSEGCEGFCLGHSHTTQGRKSKTSAYTPNIVSTSYGVKALIEIHNYFPEKNYDEIAYSSTDFIFKELDYREDGGEAKIKYYTTDSDASYTLNSNALGGRLLIDLYSKFPDDNLINSATKIFYYVISKQTKIGGWMYRDPPSSSHLNMDNFHNGFIIESLLRYKEVTNSDRYDKALKKSLKFYREVLFNRDGSPNWDEKSKYPKDIHASAQGIITFTEAGDLDFAKKILDWTLDNLYAGDGQFYYQKRRFYTKKFTLMRWCQAWMAYAISKYLIERSED